MKTIGSLFNIRVAVRSACLGMIVLGFHTTVWGQCTTEAGDDTACSGGGLTADGGAGCGADGAAGCGGLVGAMAQRLGGNGCGAGGCGAGCLGDGCGCGAALLARREECRSCLACQGPLDGPADRCGMPAPQYPVPFATPRPTVPTYYTYPPLAPHNSLHHYRGIYSYRHGEGLSRTNVMWYAPKGINTLKYIHHLIELPR